MVGGEEGVDTIAKVGVAGAPAGEPGGSVGVGLFEGVEEDPRAVHRLREGEAVGVVGEPHLAPERRLEVRQPVANEDRRRGTEFGDRPCGRRGA